MDSGMDCPFKTYRGINNTNIDQQKLNLLNCLIIVEFPGVLKLIAPVMTVIGDSSIHNSMLMYGVSEGKHSFKQIWYISYFYVLKVIVAYGFLKTKQTEGKCCSL